MSLNYKEIDLILEELDLAGSFIQQIYQPVHSLLIFDLHKPGRSFSVLISLEPGACRLHLLTSKYKNPQRPQRFASFLRARIKGGRISAAGQLFGERIIKLEISTATAVTLLWIRLWSGAANVVVTDLAGNVQDACYRRKQRNEISGGFYDPVVELAQQERPVRDETMFAPRQLPGEGSFNARVEAFYSEKTHDEDYSRLVAQARQVLENRRAYYLETQLSLQQELKNNCYYQRYKELGDILMSRIGSVPKDSRWIRAQDFFNDNQEIEIELNSELSLQDNAQAYYKKYRKARQHWEEATEKATAVGEKLIYLEEQYRQVVEQQNDELIREWAARKEKKQIPVADKKIPGLVFLTRGFRIHVGRNAIENDKLLRSFVRGSDYWFHVRDFAGGYVFVKSIPGKSLPLEVMLDAGNLAILHSKAKSSGRGDVYYTQVKYLRRPKQGKKGLVIPTQEKNLHIVMEAARIENLKKKQELY